MSGIIPWAPIEDGDARRLPGDIFLHDEVPWGQAFQPVRFAFLDRLESLSPRAIANQKHVLRAGPKIAASPPTAAEMTRHSADQAIRWRMPDAVRCQNFAVASLSPVKRMASGIEPSSRPPTSSTVWLSVRR